MCRPAVGSHSPSFSTQYSNSDANPRSRNSCRSSSSAKYARNSAVTWLRRPTTLESPAKSSSSENDFKRYSYCPIPLVYHAHFRARKTRMALVLGSKSLPPDSAHERSILSQLAALARKSSRPSRSRTTHSQIFGPANSANSVAAAGAPPPIRADELVEFDALRDTRRGATAHSALAPTCTRARTPGTRTHTQPDHSSPVAPTFPRLRPQNHRAVLDVPTSYRASHLLLAALSRESRHSQCRERSRIRTMPPPPLAH